MHFWPNRLIKVGAMLLRHWSGSSLLYSEATRVGKNHIAAIVSKTVCKKEFSVEAVATAAIANGITIVAIVCSQQAPKKKRRPRCAGAAHGQYPPTTVEIPLGEHV